MKTNPKGLALLKKARLLSLKDTSFSVAETTHKGLSKATRRWVKGRHVHITGKDYLYSPVSTDASLTGLLERVEIIPSTLCEATGFLDKNGQGIYYNGDILRLPAFWELQRKYVLYLVDARSVRGLYLRYICDDNWAFANRPDLAACYGDLQFDSSKPRILDPLRVEPLMGKTTVDIEVIGNIHDFFSDEDLSDGN